MNDVGTTTPKPVAVGDLAPPFCLPSAQGGVVALEDAIRNGPALLWFSPGVV